MRLHLLTAVTRPDFIPRIGESVEAARRPGADLIWHLREDPARQHVGGQALKNAMIDGIGDGWLIVLDDDNLLHARLVERLLTVTTEQPDAGLIVVGQEMPGGYRSAQPGCLRVEHVDAAQLIIRRDVLGALRLPETYAGDGLLAETLAATLAAEQIVYLDEPLSYYNYLHWGKR
jgi:hypothetical protein